VQEYAFNAQAQGAHGLDGMAKAGSSGKHVSNIHKALVALFGRPKGAPELSWVNIPTASSPGKAHPFLFPQNFFSKLYQERHACWQKFVCGAPGAALDFWRHMEPTPFVQKHPVLCPGVFDHTIPIGFHGDAGGFTEHESLIVLSWNSLLGTGSTR
jgi:hypothetical protein